MTAEQYINQLTERTWKSIFKLHAREALLSLKLKHTFKDFAVTLAKQKAILDGHDLILTPKIWTNYVLEITKEEFDAYMLKLLGVE
jgi:hypothetical protein